MQLIVMLGSSAASVETLQAHVEAIGVILKAAMDVSAFGLSSFLVVFSGAQKRR